MTTPPTESVLAAPHERRSPSSGEGRVDLFQGGDFSLASGQRSPFKIECDALSSDEWCCLAQMLVAVVPPFGRVEGVPRGGLPLAAAMQHYSTEGPLLLVDDVWTTGGSMKRYRGDRQGVLGAVVFARGRVEPWVTPLWTLTTQSDEIASAICGSDAVGSSTSSVATATG